MTELRSVDPRTLQFNPHNPRRTATSRAMDEQLLASIRAIGIIQPRGKGAARCALPCCARPCLAAASRLPEYQMAV